MPTTALGPFHLIYLILKTIVISFLHLFIFERQRTSGEGAEREGDAESKASFI